MANRANYAAFVTVLLAVGVLTLSSTMVLQLKALIQRPISPRVATPVVVGCHDHHRRHGDTYPVTPAGRIVAVFVMFSGVGIIGALASILASFLCPSPRCADHAGRRNRLGRQEPAALRRELAALREAIENPTANPRT